MLYKQQGIFKTLCLIGIPALFIGGLGVRLFYGNVSAELVQSTASSFFIPCVFHWITSLDCPGCGITRSMISFFLWSPYWSFYFHPLGPVLGVFLLYYWISLFSAKMELWICHLGKYVKSYSWSLCAVIVAWGILRNIL